MNYCPHCGSPVDPGDVRVATAERRMRLAEQHASRTGDRERSSSAWCWRWPCCSLRSWASLH
jgi:hypothetical protein